MVPAERVTNPKIIMDGLKTQKSETCAGILFSKGTRLSKFVKERGGKIFQVHVMKKDVDDYTGFMVLVSAKLFLSIIPVTYSELR